MELDSCEFHVVKRKKGKKTGRNVEVVTHDNHEDGPMFDKVSFKRRLVECMQEIRLTELVENCTDYLMSVNVYQEEKCLCPSSSRFGDTEDSEQQQHSNFQPCPQLLSYGIGRFTSCPIARYQLAFLLVLREKLKNPPCHIYDPVFSSREKEVIEDFECKVISHNEEGKRVCDSRTILFMPHCGKALYNNVIWANLNTLENLVIIGNSFSRMLDSNPHRLLSKTANYVIKVAPYMVETPLKPASFVHTDVFNDLSFHIFPKSKLINALPEFGENNTEPVYTEEEVEIIQKSIV